MIIAKLAQLHVIILTSTYVASRHYRGIGTGPAGRFLARPHFQDKIKFHFCKKQVMNRCASMIFRLVRLIILLYNR